MENDAKRKAPINERLSFGPFCSLENSLRGEDWESQLKC